jgi:hypothetical protein
MLRGRFGDTSGQPYIEGRLLIKKLQVCSFFSFCIDTGSDDTVLLPIDSGTIPIDFSKLNEISTSCTLNGDCNLYIIPARLQFFEPTCIYSYDIELKIAPMNPEIMELPSIVGRNIIDHWSMNYCRIKKRLNIKVLDADLIQHYIPTP